MTGAIKSERLPLEPGTILAERFEIVEFLGAGSFGEVYRARQLLFGSGFRDVALKLFKEGVVTAKNAREILNDALVAFGLLDENPTLEIGGHLVQVYDMGIIETPAPRAFITMKLIPGKKTLKSEIYRFRHAGGMPVALSLRYMRELLLPLAWMHGLESPAVHGDLKPENVMLTDDSRLVLVDFGLAARMPLGVRGGTIAYDAPEKLLDQIGGPAADVYSAGIIWYELLTGQHPFKDVGQEEFNRDNRERYTQAHIAARKRPICAKEKLPASQWHERITPASEINLDLAEQHPQIELLLNKCLADDISERFPNARVLLNSINDYINNKGTLTNSDLDAIGVQRKVGTDTYPQVTKQPTNERSLDNAEAFLLHDNPERTLAEVDRFLGASPESVRALLIKAKALTAMSGRIDDAEGVCEQAMLLDSKNPKVYETIALVREAQGKHHQAAEYRKQASGLRRLQATERRHRA